MNSDNYKSTGQKTFKSSRRDQDLIISFPTARAEIKILVDKSQISLVITEHSSKVFNDCACCSYITDINFRPYFLPLFKNETKYEIIWH